jgi:surface polysaccharide O-acyltransferase-like enzyme
LGCLRLAIEQKSEGTTLPVDVIRSLAIFLVLLVHATNEVFNPSIDLLSPQHTQLLWTFTIYDSIARICIPLFVMLTGALLLTPSKADEPIRVFFKKRWKRIGIPVIFWGATYFAWRYFVQGEALTLNSILQGTFSGPYEQFWFIYMLIGLYLITPVFRVVVAHANWSVIKYFLLVWFVGTAIMPLLEFYGPISGQVFWFNGTVFNITKLIGYFILGAYITRIHIKKPVLYAVAVASNVFTVFGTVFLLYAMGTTSADFFLQYTSFNVIISSVSIILILSTIQPKTIHVKWPILAKSLSIISVNTLGIFLIQYIPMETLQKGYLGLKISVTNMNPIVEMPLIAILTLLICLAIIIPLKKIPYIRRIMG